MCAKGEAKVTRSFLFDTCDKFLSVSDALSKYCCNPDNSQNIKNLLSLNITKSAAMEPNSTFNLSEVADFVNEQIKRIDTRLQDVNSDLSTQADKACGIRWSGAHFCYRVTIRYH